MSRTDKDRPYWVRVRDIYETRYPDHDHGYSNIFGNSLTCDIHINVKPQHNLYGSVYPLCSYELGYSEVDNFCIRYYAGDTKMKRVRRNGYNKPERRRKRDGLKVAVQQYNAGDYDHFDFDYANYHHRHSMRGYSW